LLSGDDYRVEYVPKSILARPGNWGKTSLGQLTALYQTHVWWKGGWLPSPKNSTPDSALGASLPPLRNTHRK